MELEPTPLDNLLDRLALVFLVIGLLVPALYYSDLPARIPIHFDLYGRPDWYAPKIWVWLLPVVSVFIYETMGRVRFSGKEENKAMEHRMVNRMLRWIRVVVMLIFGFLTWAIIQVALGRWEGLGVYFLPVFLITLFGIIGYHYFRLHQFRKNNSS